VSPFLHRVVFGYDMRTGFFATKALLATSFVWTLALLPVALGGLLRFLATDGGKAPSPHPSPQGRGRRGAGAAFVLATAGACYANLLVGGAFLALVVAGLAVIAARDLVAQPPPAVSDSARPPLAQPRAAVPRRAGRVLAAIGLAAVSAGLVIPYALMIAGAPAGQERLASLAAPDAFHLSGLALGLLPMWACVAVAGWPRRRTAGLLWLAFLAAAFAAGLLLLRIVDGNEYKFPFIIALLLAVWVGVMADELSLKRRRLLWLLAASCVPTTTLGLVAHALDPGLVISDAERQTFAWIAANTPPDTVVVSRWRATLVPIYSDRDLYVPDTVGFHRGARYDRAEWARREAQMRRLDAGEVAPVLAEIQREQQRPVVLVTQTQLLRPDDPRPNLLFAVGDLATWALWELGEHPHGIKK